LREGERPRAPARVVVGAAVDLAAPLEHVERAERALAQVVVVRADDEALRRERAPFLRRDGRDDVPQAAVVLPELLEEPVAVARGLDADRLELGSDPVAGLPAAVRARLAPPELVGRQRLDRPLETLGGDRRAGVLAGERERRGRREREDRD